jgi:hypothetical protein
VAALIKRVLVAILPIKFLVHPQQITSFDGFIANIHSLFSQDLVMFNANAWGEPIRPLSTVVIALNALLLSVVLLVAWRLLRRAVANRNADASTQIIGALPFWIVGIVTVSLFSDGARYLILLPFALMLSLMVAVARGFASVRMAAVIVVLSSMSALYNVGAAAHQLAVNPADQANGEEKVVAQELHEHHLTKGFANYWRANITTYYSNYYSDIASIDCNNAAGTVSFDPILSERGILAKPASNSFVLYYPNSLGQSPECTLQTITNQFGPPAEVVSIPTSQGGKLAIYRHDVSGELLR